MNKKLLTTIGVTALLFGTAAMLEDKIKGIDLTAIDKNVNPGEDFYRYANGNWIANNPVPSTESRWSSFNIVSERNNETLRQILEEAAADVKAPAGSTKQKVGAFYRVYMDTLKRDQQGSAPVKPLLDKINSISSKADLIKVVADLHKKGIRGFFNFYVSQDLKNSTSYIVYVSQGGLGLPDRDYYTKTDKKSEETRIAYLAHVTKMAELFGMSTEGFSTTVMKIETDLATKSMTRTERRNQEKQYNKRSFNQFKIGRAHV